MGHRHTSAQLGGYSEVLAAGCGAGAVAPQRDQSRAAIVAVEAGRSRSARLLLGMVRFYQAFLSPFYGASCKFYPSCSQYAYQAIEGWGARRGAGLALRRLLRCRPFSSGGYDPVPEREGAAQ
jgi:putative membrane protein insertion efficiency factor